MSTVGSFSHIASGLTGLAAGQRSMLLTVADFGKPATISDLCEHTGLHANSVREMLAVLVDMGLVQRHQVPSSTRGRPAWEYEASVPVDVNSVMGEFANFAQSVCQFLRSSAENPDDDARAIGALWGKQLLSEFSDHGQRHEHHIAAMGRDELLAHPIAKVRILLSGLGFGAVAGPTRHSINLTLCPFMDNGHAPDPLICHMHAGMLSAMMQRLSAGHIDADMSVGIPHAPCVVSLKYVGPEDMGASPESADA